MEAYPTALWYSADQRQQPFKTGRMSDFDGIKECEDLVSFALEGVTEPTIVYDQSPRNRIALRLVANKFDVHNFGSLFFIAVLVVDADEGAAEGEYFAKSDEDGVMDLAQWWAEEARYQ